MIDVKRVVRRIKLKMYIRKITKEMKEELKDYCKRINKEVLDDLEYFFKNK